MALLPASSCAWFRQDIMNASISLFFFSLQHLARNQAVSEARRGDEAEEERESELETQRQSQPVSQPASPQQDQRIHTYSVLILTRRSRPWRSPGRARDPDGALHSPYLPSPLSRSCFSLCSCVRYLIEIPARFHAPPTPTRLLNQVWKFPSPICPPRLTAGAHKIVLLLLSQPL